MHGSQSVEHVLRRVPEMHGVSVHGVTSMKFLKEDNKIYLVAYVLEPRSQNMDPNIKARKAVYTILTAEYRGLRQYDKCCFHVQAMHCAKKD